ncbi:hypothetical protein AA0X95_16600 [Bacillus sp. 1P10SD]|uniref:hypothetical protein n=1 Tax=Bacillus sp. 1P10SD TaxID=3132265 RepID=UPI0039A6C61B
MKYEKHEVLKMLDSDTISALLKIYGLTYQHLALPLRCTRQNVLYLLKSGNMKDYQKAIILDIFTSYGMETAELMLIHQMTSKAKKLKGRGINE